MCDTIIRGGWLRDCSEVPFETVDVSEVNASFDELMNTEVSLPIFEDLADGISYGSFTIEQDFPEFDCITIPLNSSALQSIEAARLSGEFWSLGLAMASLDDDPGTFEFLFPSSNNIPLSDTFLRITTIPAPSALALFGIAALSSGRRRSTTWSSPPKPV